MAATSCSHFLCIVEGEWFVSQISHRDLPIRKGVYRFIKKATPIAIKSLRRLLEH